MINKKISKKNLVALFSVTAIASILCVSAYATYSVANIVPGENSVVYHINSILAENTLISTP